MVSDPSSTMTSQFAVKALEDRGLLQALVRALTSPVPHGQDGELDGDPDFQEKLVRQVVGSSYTCRSFLTASCLGRF